jgi:hypothetical protein
MNLLRKLLLGSILLALSAPVFAQAPSAPQPAGPAPFQLADDGMKTLVDGPGAAKDYRVTNNGPDGSIEVLVVDKDNHILRSATLEVGESTDLGVPADGKLIVHDPKDGDSNGASGTYEVV